VNGSKIVHPIVEMKWK